MIVGSNPAKTSQVFSSFSCRMTPKRQEIWIRSFHVEGHLQNKSLKWMHFNKFEANILKLEGYILFYFQNFCFWIYLSISAIFINVHCTVQVHQSSLIILLPICCWQTFVATSHVTKVNIWIMRLRNSKLNSDIRVMWAGL